MTDIAYSDYRSDVRKLQKRIRELEAELAKWTNVFGPSNKGATPQDWHDEMMKTEARVAELDSHNHWTKCELCAREREEC